MSDLKLGKYRHFKGGEYRVILVANDCENPERKVVVYQALYVSDDFPFGTFWVRDLEDFMGFKEVDGKKIKRFEFIGE